MQYTSSKLSAPWTVNNTSNSSERKRNTYLIIWDRTNTDKKKGKLYKKTVTKPNQNKQRPTSVECGVIYDNQAASQSVACQVGWINMYL